MSINPQQLQLPDGTKIDAWRCEVCGLIWQEFVPVHATPCCTCRDCGVTIDPKVEGARKLFCDKCWGPHYAEEDADRMARAEEIVGYDGPVCVGDQYWPNVDEFSEWDEAYAEFVHTCHIHGMTLDLDGALDDLIENANVEEMDHHDFVGMAELHAAADKFNDANKGREYWVCDSKHKVRVPAPSLHWTETDDRHWFTDSAYCGDGEPQDLIWQLDLAPDDDPAGTPARVANQSSPQLLPDGELPEWETIEAARAWCEAREAELMRKVVAR